MAHLCVGAGRADITPPLGLDLTGFIARNNPATEQLSSLWARVLLLDVGGCRLLIAALDLLGLDTWLVEHLRTCLASEFGLAPEAISLWCSHTHSGPASILLHGCGRRDEKYLRGTLVQGVCAAAHTARDSLAPATARWAVTEAPQWHEYRRAALPGAADAPLVDHSLRVLWFDRASGDPVACLWWYTAHPTLLCLPAISSEYPGAVATQVEAATGAIALFGQGCAGDVGPVLAEDRLAAMTAMADGLAQPVLSLRSEAVPLHLDTAASAESTLDLPLQRAPSRDWFADHAVRQQETAASLPPGVSRRIALAMADWAEHWALHEAPESWRVRLQVLCLGPLRVAVLPFETLSAVGNAIARHLGEPYLVVSYANGCHSYLARAGAYPSGGYEINEAYRYYGLPNTYAPAAAEQVIAESCRLAGVLSGKTS